MSLFGRQKRFFGITDPSQLIPVRPGPSGTGSVHVTNDTAMRHSAVWASLRLRGNLISTMPVDVYRDVAGIPVEVPTPPVLVTPGGDRVDICEWLYSSQVDLDRAGNCFGLITERNGAGLPARIDLQNLGDCSVRDRGGEITYRIGRKTYTPDQVWHERQYTVSGLPVGLSPVAYAAWTIGQYQSAQQFAVDWFGSGGIPKAIFRNTTMEIPDQGAADSIKARFKAAVEGRDLFVTGKDWEYKPIQAEAVGADWLEAQKFGIGDVARFFDVPGDLIDAAVSTGNITYASITQRNLQLLIMHIGPAVYRRERALSNLLPKPRYVKLNTNALLRMDPLTQAQVLGLQLEKRILGVSEARSIYDRPPLTAEQIGEFTEVYGKPRDTWAGNPQPDEPVVAPAKEPTGVTP